MRKILKSIRSKITKIIPCILTALTLVCNPIASFTTAYAAPAVVPVGVELIGELLVALGLMVGNATDGYVWKANDNPYVSSIFEDQVAGITSGVPVSTETLGALKDTVIPDGVYETDGTNFYVADKPLTTADIFVNAKSLAGISYGIPINIDGAQGFSSVGSAVERVVIYSPRSDVASGGDFYYIPYYVGKSGSHYVLPQSLHFPTPTTCYTYDYRSKKASSTTTFSSGLLRYIGMTVKCGYDIKTSDSSNGYSNGSVIGYTQDDVGGWSGFQVVTGSGDDLRNSGELDSYKISSATWLRTTGLPILDLQGDKESLGNAVVKVEPPKDDDNDNKTPPVPQSPNNWEIWKSIEDLVKFIDTGEVNNGNTDYGDFVNNNYNYVNVNLNVPDTINNNVNISGGLDVNTSGSVDITIHEDVSLPSGGDGSGFYNPDAVDAIAALTTNNPAVQLIKGLFEAIDPVLVGIFSVGVSLLVVLGLWKLIRG